MIKLDELESYAFVQYAKVQSLGTLKSLQEKFQ